MTSEQSTHKERFGPYEIACRKCNHGDRWLAWAVDGDISADGPIDEPMSADCWFEFGDDMDGALCAIKAELKSKMH